MLYRKLGSAVACFAVAFPLAAQMNRDPVPLKNWTVPFEQIRGKSAQTRNLHPVSNAVPSNPSDFITVVPCRVVDTRNPNSPYGGPKLVGGVSRTFNIPGGPCTGIPTSAAAFSLNFTVVNVVAPDGFLTPYPTGAARPLVSALNFTVGQIIGNSAIVPAGSGGSIDVYVNISTDLIIDINGYFAEGAAARTVSVSPIGTTTQNGTALLNAIAAITDNSATNPYLIKIAPGIYDVGATPFTMKPYVDVEGSGEGVTKITSGTGESSIPPAAGTVVGTNNAELRLITVENRGENGGNNYAIAVFNSGTSLRLTHVTAAAVWNASSIALNFYGIWNTAGGVLTLTDVTAIVLDQSGGAVSDTGLVVNAASATVIDSTISINGAFSLNRAVQVGNGGSLTLINTTVTVSAGGSGIYTYGTVGTLMIHRSTIVPGLGQNSIVNSVPWPVKVAGTQLAGTVNNSGGGTFVCVASYNASFVALTTACN